MLNTLVLCTGNSARSILLEAILRDGSAGRISSFSAGAKPTGRVHPEALALLSRKGHATEGMYSKSWDAFTGPDAPKMDLVITVCGNAAEAGCPVWQGQPVTAHWGVTDPAFEGPYDAVRTAFEQAYDQLSSCAERLLCAGVDFDDPTALQRLVAQIKPPQLVAV
jgi:protein-tyrosine-phosphatase